MLTILYLVLVPAILAQVPTGCVTFQNVGTGKFLTSTNISQANLRMARDNETKARWKIEKFDENYKIQNSKFKEYLVVSKRPLHSERSIYTASPGTAEANTLDKWKIEKKDGQSFTISNGKYPGCLFFGAFGNAHSKEGQNCTGEIYQWTIEKC